MARLRFAFLVACALAVTGCGGAGGGGRGGASKVPCDDAAFRNQTEELYVAIATAQNARTPGAPAAVVADLERGAEVLRNYLAAHPPCDAELKALAEDERAAVATLGSAVSALEAGKDPSSALADAVGALGRAERALR